MATSLDFEIEESTLLEVVREAEEENSFKIKLEEMAMETSSDFEVEESTLLEVVREAEEENKYKIQKAAPALIPHLSSVDSIFSLGGQEFVLNDSGTKHLVIGLSSSSIPNLKIIFKLHDLKNGYCIQFNKKSWNAIIKHQNEISDYMDNNMQDHIFNNFQIRAETAIFYNKCCIAFFDLNETHVVLAPSTFERLISLKNEIEKCYADINKKIKDVMKRFKLFMDHTFFLLLKSNNIDNLHNYSWLMFMNESPDFVELNNSIANTWKNLGKFISNEQTIDQESHDVL